jgi:hypothetical protein
MSAPIQFDAQRSLLTIGDRRVVFHCHHYNVVLQRTLDEGLGPRAAEIQQRAAMESSRAAISAALGPADGAGAPRIARAASLFGALGFGHANVKELGPLGGRVLLDTSHYAIGWRAKFEASTHPVCHFAVGFWAAATCLAWGHASERVVAREVRCAACGDSPCEIEIEVL